MFDMPVIEHCEEQTLKGDGVAHEGFHASTLGLRGIPGEAESIMALRDISLAELTGGARAHRAHERPADARRRALRQGARRAGHLRGDAASLRPDRRDAGRAGALRHEREDESAAARDGRPRRDARRASPTAASTSSPPITRRITTTRSTSSSITRRSASPASRPRCRSASIGSSTPASISLSRLIELLSVNPARILRRAGRIAVRGRAGGHLDPRARSARSRCRPSACGRKSKNTPFDGWTLRGGVAATIVGGRSRLSE